jgi:hypothetical protein
LLFHIVHSCLSYALIANCYYFDPLLPSICYSSVTASNFHFLSLKTVLMVRLYSISLLFLFLMNVIGGISFLLIQQYQRHEYVESMIKSKSYGHRLTQIHVAADELTEIIWVERNHEFRYKGDMYDVVRSEATPDSGKIYHCIADHEETKLYSEIESNLGNAPIGHHNDRRMVLQMFKFFSGFLDTPSLTNESRLYSIQKCNSLYISSSPEVTLSLRTQPPELV